MKESDIFFSKKKFSYKKKRLGIGGDGLENHVMHGVKINQLKISLFVIRI